MDNLAQVHPYHLTYHTIWWLFTQHFGIRGRQEHHSMKVEDFIFKKDDNSNEFLTFSEGITKTRQSGIHEKHRLVIPKILYKGKLADCHTKTKQSNFAVKPENVIMYDYAS